MLNGLSLFSGYAGIDLALSGYVRPILYCDTERYAQGIILSRMDDGSIPFAPIWNDVTTLDGSKFRGLVDIIYGGFPCQDISVAGKGAGLEGERSGLFGQIIRLAKEASPSFIFLENVPAIRTRGSVQVQEALASIGYDTRWLTLSAAEVGANHKRERWFCLASNTNSMRLRDGRERCQEGQAEADNFTGDHGKAQPVAHTMRNGFSTTEIGQGAGKNYDRDTTRENGCSVIKGRQAVIRRNEAEPSGSSGKIPDTDLQGQCREASPAPEEDHKGIREDYWWTEAAATHSGWWSVEPGMGRVANGVKNRAHRIKALGNGVVPLQVKTAFEILMGRTP